MSSGAVALGLLVLSAVTACGKGDSACAELKKQSPDGVTLATAERRCSELLEFGKYVEHHYGMDFKTWLATVPAQGVAFVHDAVFALTSTTSAQGVTSFAATPSTPPCGPGLAVTDDVWASMPMATFVRSRPTRLYISFSVELQRGAPNIATLRAYQDYDCDHHVDVLEVVGEYSPGQPAVSGGWRLLHSATPAVDE